MGSGMPYHLEKGVTLRLIEKHLNRDRSRMAATLCKLRKASSADDWVSTVLPDLWRDDGFQIRDSSAQHVRQDWFGIDRADIDHGGTGYWIGYRGDVEQIVRKAFIWALELALGVEHGEDPSASADAGPPDRIELFWTCSIPWFEAWVVRRPVEPDPEDHERASEEEGDEGDEGEVGAVGAPSDAAERGPGLVTINFITPAHEGAHVADSPLATATDALANPNPGLPFHPVPSVEIDYEVLGEPWSHGEEPGGHVEGDRPRVPAHKRQHATWIVTHRKHELITDDHRDEDGDFVERMATTGARAFGDLTMPQLSTYEGTCGVVVVSPSLRAGGITHDGKVVPQEHPASALMASGASPAPTASPEEV